MSPIDISRDNTPITPAQAQAAGDGKGSCGGKCGGKCGGQHRMGILFSKRLLVLYILVAIILAACIALF